MNVRGERILIFGDSLSHHGSDNAPEIWDVDTGSARISGQPGDLLASMLAEQGATAVRVNARVGRSAHNFWGREDTSSLLASDQAFAPTKVMVILGTNDIGLNLDIDGAEMAQIRDFYKDLGAEVWGVGPFMYVSDTLNKQAMPVADMMSKTFGSRWIDPRDVTPLQGRAGDGVHFAPGSARELALALQQMVLTTSSPLPWKTIAIGVAMALGGALAYNYWKRGVVALPFGELEAADDDTPDDETWKSDEAGWVAPEEQLRRRILDPDPASMEIAQDLALQHGIKLSEWSQTISKNQGRFVLKGARSSLNATAVSWKIDDEHKRHGTCGVKFNVIVDGQRVGGRADRIPTNPYDVGPVMTSREFKTTYQGSGDFCRRAATADAWAIAKRIKHLQLQIPNPNVMREKAVNEIDQTLDQNNSEPADLYGLKGRWHGDETRLSQLEAKEKIVELLGKDTDEDREIARDIAIQHGMIMVGTVESMRKLPRNDQPAYGHGADETYEIVVDGKTYVTGDSRHGELKPGATVDYMLGQEAWWKGKRNLVFASFPHGWSDRLRKKFVNTWWPKDGSAPLPLEGLDESCNPNLSREAFVRCTKRQRRGLLGLDWKPSMRPNGESGTGEQAKAPHGEYHIAVGEHIHTLFYVDPKKGPKAIGTATSGDRIAQLKKKAEQHAAKRETKGLSGSEASEIRAAMKARGYQVKASGRSGIRGPWEAVATHRDLGVLSTSGHASQLDALRALIKKADEAAPSEIKGFREYKKKSLKGLDAARRRPEQETKTTEDGPGFNPPRQGELQIGRDNLSYKDLPWSKVIAEAKKEAKSESSNKLHLSMHVKHAPNDHTPFAHVSWDPMDSKGAIAFAKKLIDDKGAMYSSVVAFAERPHDRSDRRAPKGHWTLASFEDDSIPDDR